MDALRDVIERRVNLFGVSEPIVQVEKGGRFAGVSEERLIVELPGVTDVAEAVALIGQTPLLEFKLLVSGDPTGAGSAVYTDTGLTGRLVKRAQLEFGSGGGGLTNEPVVILSFNKEGSDLFEKITTEHVGRNLGIFLDGEVISAPVIREPITGGTATISGGFTPDEARLLVRDLNFGALPLPIELISTQTIGARREKPPIGIADKRSSSSALPGLSSYETSVILPPVKSMPKLSPHTSTAPSETTTRTVDSIKNIFLFFITNIIQTFLVLPRCPLQVPYLLHFLHTLLVLFSPPDP